MAKFTLSEFLWIPQILNVNKLKIVNFAVGAKLEKIEAVPMLPELKERAQIFLISACLKHSHLTSI